MDGHTSVLAEPFMCASGSLSGLLGEDEGAPLAHWTRCYPSVLGHGVHLLEPAPPHRLRPALQNIECPATHLSPDLDQ